MAMTPVDWETVNLCTIDDVKERIHSLSLPAMGEEKKAKEKIEKKIALAKKLITQEIRAKVIPRFIGVFSVDQLETHLNYLKNPGELVYAAVDLTLALLLEDGELVFTADWERDAEKLRDLADKYYKRYAEKLTLAIGLLNFDRLAGTTGERVAERPRYTTYRR
jgi:hypothetical protein